MHAPVSFIYILYPDINLYITFNVPAYVHILHTDLHLNHWVQKHQQATSTFDVK